MKIITKTILAIIISLSILGPALAVPVGNDVEYIPAPRNLGIGVIDPDAKLEVNGQVKITGGSPQNSYVLTSDAFGLATWEPVSVANVSNATTANVADFATSAGSATSATVADKAKTLVAPNGSTVIGTTTATGNLGLGTTSPTQKLEVAGDVKANNFHGSGAGLFNINAASIVGNLNIGIDDLTDGIAGFQNVFLGDNAGVNTTSQGQANVGIGQDSLRLNQSGDSNVAIGKLSLQQNTTGNVNTAVGVGALRDNRTGSYNVALGANSILAMNSGEGNVALGSASLNHGAFSGNRNIAIGMSAATNLASGSNNIVIGQNNDILTGSSVTVSNHLDIADAIFGDLLSKNIGIGDSSPDEKLTVAGNVKANNFIGSAAGLTGINNVSNATTANVADFATSAGTATSSTVSDKAKTLVAPNGTTVIATTTAAGRLGVGITNPSAALFEVFNQSSDSKIGIYSRRITTTSANTASYDKAIYGYLGEYSVSSGVTDSGYKIGLDASSYSNTAGFAGTLNTAIGVWARSGIYNASSGARINTVQAITADVLNHKAGTSIGNAYGINIASFGSAGAITNGYGVFIGNVDGDSNQFGVYQSHSSDNNYFAGNLGIGDTTPEEKLTVIGSVKATNFIGSAAGLTGINNVSNATTANVADFATSAGAATSATTMTGGTITNSTFTGGTINNATLNNVVISPSTHDHSRLVNPSNSSVALTVDGQSDVGIGTTNPTTDLHVVSNTIDGGVMVSSTLSPKYPILRGPVSTAFGTPNSDSFRIGVDNNFAGSSLDYLVFDKTDGNEANPDGGIVFTNTGNDGVQETALIIKGNGWIGVGETSPHSLLSMKGDNATLTAQHTNEGAWSEFRTAGVNSSGNFVKKWGVGSTGDTRPTANGGQDKFYVFQYTDAADNNVNRYRMVITPAGNVGFGTESPIEKLQVVGNVKATQFIGDGSMLTGINTANVDNATTANVADYATAAGTATMAGSATTAGTATNLSGGNINNASIVSANITGQIIGGIINGSRLINVDIVDPNDPWILVHSEDFQSGVSGWSNNTTTTCAGHRILGGYGVAGSGARFQKSFNLSAYPHSHVMIKFNYYSLDTWDDHAAVAQVDGFTIWTENRLHYVTQGREVFPNCGSGGYSGYKDRVLQGDAKIEHTANNLTLNFTSTLDEGSTNESFGIDNLEIWVKRSGMVTTVPTPPTPPGPSDNAGCAADGFYHVLGTETSAGGTAKGFGHGPSTANFTQCDKVTWVDGGHSVTRTWTFTSPPRSGNVVFKVQKRRNSGDSNGPGIWYWFQNNISLNVSQSYHVGDRNADITYNCNYNKPANSYSCTVTKVVL